MEFILQKEICKEFLDKYNKNIYPELLAKIIEIGILTLKLSFNKLSFSPEELEDIIYSLNEQCKLKKNQFKMKKLKKLTNKYFTLEKNRYDTESKENETSKLNTISFDNNMYINNSNFYDSNYIVPESRKLRNRQLYKKRLENPLFTTQNKNVYPFWWWNFPDESDSEGENNSYNESDVLSKSQSKSFNNQSLSKSFNTKDIFDESKIFKKSNNNNDINVNYYNINDKNNFKKVIRNNYKISYDRNLNMIGVEKSENNRKQKYKK